MPGHDETLADDWLERLASHEENSAILAEIRLTIPVDAIN